MFAHAFQWADNRLDSPAAGQSRYRATFDHAPVGIAHVAPDGSFIELNDMFAAITGHPREALLEHGFQQITHPDDLETDLRNVERMLSGTTDRYSMEKRYIRPDGSIVWVNLTVALIRDAIGAPDFFISIIEDLTELLKTRAQAIRDPLTGLLNRRGFEDRLVRERARSGQDAPLLTLIYVDLDGFKAINDRLGHAAGDSALALIARRFEALVHREDRIARVGGDEFLLLLHDLSDDARDAMVAALRAAVEGIEVRPGWAMSASFGAIGFAADDPRTSEQLIALADQAMFAEKRDRRTCR